VKLYKDSVIRAVDSAQGKIWALNKDLYAHPEVAFHEYKAVQRITNLLELEGFEIERNLAGLETAFRARYPAMSANGPVIALLAEYDALPKIGHGCGHNMIASAAVGAALSLKPLLEELCKSVQVIGTPAEEGGGGKVLLAEGGVFDGIDVVMMTHPSNITAICATSLARVKVEIEFHGKAAQIFMDQERGVSALAATIQTFNGVNALRGNLKPYHTMIHGIITRGGESAVTTPDLSESSFFIMAPQIEEAREVYDKLAQCAEGAATMTGAKVAFHSYGEYKEFVPNRALAQAFGKNLEHLGVPIDEKNMYDGIMCALDIGDVGHLVPSIHPYIDLGKNLTWHTPEVTEATVSDSGRSVLLNAAKALAMTAVDIYTDKTLLKKIKKDFTLSLKSSEKPS